MSAIIFISYTNRDKEGSEWAGRIAEWLREWGYKSLFLQKDPLDGIPAASEWRSVLNRRLRQCRAMVTLCSPRYAESNWCVAEVAVAVAGGKLVFPLHFGKQYLPSILQDRQVIALEEAIELSPEVVDEARERLKRGLDQQLNWRDRLRWDPQPPNRSPFPGLEPFDETYAAVFHGRDQAITEVHEQLRSLRDASSPLMLLLGSSGCGKSSLVRAGVVPQLKADPAGNWIVLEPFRPLRSPFAGLREVLAKASAAPGQPPRRDSADSGSAEMDAVQLLDQLDDLRQRRGRREAFVLIVIDQFEELLTPTDKAQGRETTDRHELEAEASDCEKKPKKKPAERFLEVLRDLLQMEGGRVLVLATLRTDFLAALEGHACGLAAQAHQHMLKPMLGAEFGPLINGPLRTVGRSMEPRLLQGLLATGAGGGDVLPLLSFTLEKLWEKREKRGNAVQTSESEKEWSDLTWADYEELGGLKGSVQTAADAAWRANKSEEAERAAVREAFLEHLVRLSEDDRPVRRRAFWRELPESSKPVLERLVKKRLLVSGVEEGSKERTLEMAHEALLSHWDTLVQWLKDGREELLQRRRVERLCQDLTPELTGEPDLEPNELQTKREQQARTRRRAIEQLAAMAAAGADEGEARAARREAGPALAELLRNPSLAIAEADRQDAALVLALIGAEEPLRQLLADGMAPVGLRRRAAESLGLLARRTTHSEQRQRIQTELEGLLRSEKLEVPLELVLDPEKLDPAVVQAAVEETQQQVQQALASDQLGDISQEQLQDAWLQLVGHNLKQRLWADGKAAGWKQLDERLPLLQGAARGLQLAMAPDLPLLGSGPGLVVPMLTLTVLEEGEGMWVRTKVVGVPVWKLPLPAGEQLELVLVPGREYGIGSPKEEDGRDVYPQNRQRCERANVEAERRVRLESFAMVRHPISQAQWRAVVEATAPEQRGRLKPNPGTFRPEDPWERYGQPGALPVDSVSWHDCREWLTCLNGWIAAQWPAWSQEWSALSSEPPRLALPSESQWEAACRAGSETPYHFGATLDPSWARYDWESIYGKGRRAESPKRPVSAGFFGLVNCLGLAELHGQVFEWCGDQWHRDPVEGAPEDGSAIDGPDPGLDGVPMEQEMRLLRGGSWASVPHSCRAAYRLSYPPVNVLTYVGVRPCCSLPPGFLLGP